MSNNNHDSGTVYDQMTDETYRAKETAEGAKSGHRFSDQTILIAAIVALVALVFIFFTITKNDSYSPSLNSRTGAGSPTRVARVESVDYEALSADLVENGQVYHLNSDDEDATLYITADSFMIASNQVGNADPIYTIGGLELQDDGSYLVQANSVLSQQRFPIVEGDADYLAAQEVKRNYQTYTEAEQIFADYILSEVFAPNNMLGYYDMTLDASQLDGYLSDLNESILPSELRYFFTLAYDYMKTQGNQETYNIAEGTEVSEQTFTYFDVNDQQVVIREKLIQSDNAGNRTERVQEEMVFEK